MIGKTLRAVGMIGSSAIGSGFGKNIFKRAAVGAVGGSIYGFASSDSYSATGQFMDTMRGATLGAAALGLGVGAVRGAPGAIRRSYQSGRLKEAGKMLWGGSKMATNAGFKIGGFALKHPVATAAIAGGGYMAATGVGMGQPMSSPTLEGATVDTRYDQQMMAMSELQQSAAAVAPTGQVGTAPMMMGPYHRALQRSTSGLVQGLHRGRHS